MGTPVNLLSSSQKCQGCSFFPNLSKLITFAAAPLVSTQFVRNQGVIDITGVYIYIYIHIHMIVILLYVCYMYIYIYIYICIYVCTYIYIYIYV